MKTTYTCTICKKEGMNKAEFESHLIPCAEFRTRKPSNYSTFIGWFFGKNKEKTKEEVKKESAEKIALLKYWADAYIDDDISGKTYQEWLDWIEKK